MFKKQLEEQRSNNHEHSKRNNRENNGVDKFVTVESKEDSEYNEKGSPKVGMVIDELGELVKAEDVASLVSDVVNGWMACITINVNESKA